MSRLLRFICLWLLIGLTLGLGLSNAVAMPAAANQAGWVEIGQGSASRGAGISQTLGSRHQNVSLAIGSDGTAVAAWEAEQGEIPEIYVRRWNGTTWVELGPGSASGGGISNSPTTKSTSPAVVVDSDGRPIVAWAQSDEWPYYKWSIYVKRWDGIAWVEMGEGSASGHGISGDSGYAPSLAIGPDNLPVIAWENGLAGKSHIYIKKWNGAAWVEMGTGSASGDGVSSGLEHSSYHSLAVGPDGNPAVAWREYNDNSGISNIYLRRWNGSAWVEMAGSATGGGISNSNNWVADSPSLAIGPDGKPAVAWIGSYNEESRIYVRRWNGTAWAEAGSGSASGAGISGDGEGPAEPSLAIGSDNVPVIAWESRGPSWITVKRWNGTTWAGVDSSTGIGSRPGFGGPSLAIGPDNRPVVAWRGRGFSNKVIYLLRWNNSAWEEMGTGSASEFGGISNTRGARNPSLAVGPDGKPIVAWEDGSSGNWEIYVKRWNGSAWVEMGAGSASGGGISKSKGQSYQPSLAIGPDGTVVVAWQDNYFDVQSWGWLYVRRWNGSAWVEMGAGSASGKGISGDLIDNDSPSVAIGSDGVPVIAWSGYGGSTQDIYVQRWNGSAWVMMGAGPASGSDNEMTAFVTPSLAIGPDKMPVVVWARNTLYEEFADIYVRRWNGSSWVKMGTGSISGGGLESSGNFSSSPSLAIKPDGSPVVAWSEMIVKPGAGQLVVIYGRRWNGSAWVEIGAGSASGDGISQNSENKSSRNPSLAIGPGGEPVVAWWIYDHIYVKRWDGTAWVEWDEGSASGKGISGMDGYGGYSAYPSLATGPNRMPVVAWVDTYAGMDDVFVRRHPPACHVLTLTHTGQGGNPVAAPANSADCPTGQYSMGESITLAATPAHGWIISGWSGTINNSSTVGVNTVTMPDAAHAASVNYRELRATNWSYIPIVPK